jgi:hypothetical protein
MSVAETMNGNIVVRMTNAEEPDAPRVRKRKMPTTIVALNCRRVDGPIGSSKAVLLDN